MLETIGLFGGALVLVLVLRWGLRKLAFATMTFDVPLGGETYKLRKGAYVDPQGRPVTDPDLLAALDEAWAAIEQRTAEQTAAIHTTRLGS
jgi:hypothetical protein